MCFDTHLFQKILWAFSIYLEALAILPQLIVLQRFGEVENLTGNYIFMLGLYRALYIANWIYRAKTEPHYHTHLITIISGVVQTALYVDFFYHYATRCDCVFSLFFVTDYLDYLVVLIVLFFLAKCSAKKLSSPMHNA
jgi:hypothetical protein